MRKTDTITISWTCPKCGHPHLWFYDRVEYFDGPSFMMCSSCNVETRLFLKEDLDTGVVFAKPEKEEKNTDNEDDHRDCPCHQLYHPYTSNHRDIEAVRLSAYLYSHIPEEVANQAIKIFQGPEKIGKMFEDPNVQLCRDIPPEDVPKISEELRHRLISDEAVAVLELMG